MSDYRFRGETISHGRPAVQAGLDVDLPAGFYVGAAAAGSVVPHDGASLIADQVYAGYARRIDGDLTIDAGATHVTYTRYSSLPIDYSEAYLGVTVRRISVHIRYSPDYFRSGNSTLYVDGQISHPLGEWAIAARAGTLARLRHPHDGPGPDWKADWGVNLSRSIGRFDVQLGASGRVGNGRGSRSSIGSPVFTLAASYGF